MRKSPLPKPEAGPMKKVLTLVGGAILLVLGLMFSVVVLIAAVTIGLMIGGYLWWKTREIRRAMRQAESTAPSPPVGGDIIEGEAVLVDESCPTDRRVLSSNADEVR